MACVRCPVCWGDEDSSWSAVATCGHVAHTKCLERCLAAKPECPWCRGRVSSRGRGTIRVFLDIDKDGDAGGSPGRTAEVLADERVQRLTRDVTTLRDDLASTRDRLTAAEDALADAAADRLDAVAAAEERAEAALLAAHAEMVAAQEKAADAVRDRDKALDAAHAAEKRAERLASSAAAAKREVRDLKVDLARANFARADLDALSDGQVAALVGAACEGADARALAPAAKKVADLANAARKLRESLADRERELKAERDAVAALRDQVKRLQSERRGAAAAGAAAAADAPRSLSAPPEPYELDYDTADVIDVVDDGPEDVAPPPPPARPPLAPLPRAPSAPLVGTSYLGASAGLKPSSFVPAAAGRRAPGEASGTFIRHGADGRGGRVSAARALAGVSVAPAPPPLPPAKRAKSSAVMASFLVRKS